MSFRNSVKNIKNSQRKPKYIVIGFFLHGSFGSAAEPYQSNPYASTSIRSFNSVPKLMTIMNCAPGNSLISAYYGIDNVILTNYFYENSEIDITAIEEETSKPHDRAISNNFLKYVNSGLSRLELNPRDRIEKFKKENPKDVDVCRNSLICNNKVGISHTFANKSFYTNNPPDGIPPGDNWGIFIYNNNVHINPGVNIKDIIPHSILSNKEGVIVGLQFDLADIISTLTERYRLTEDDYLFLFDYSCSNINKEINPDIENERIIRYHGNEIGKLFGFGKKKSKKRGKKRIRTLKKRKM
jgi:hypothetical protein